MLKLSKPIGIIRRAAIGKLHGLLDVIWNDRYSLIYHLQYSTFGMQASFGLIQEKNTGNLNHSAKDWRKSSSSRDWETARPVDLIWNEAL
jgi:hypothetical protein